MREKAQEKKAQKVLIKEPCGLFFCNITRRGMVEPPNE
jgi:hypothetical protein